MNLFWVKLLLCSSFVMDIAMGQYQHNSGRVDMTHFRKKCLDRHNYWRKRHRSPHMVQNHKLNLWAQAWAEEIARRDRMEHRPGNPYGENIYTYGPAPQHYNLRAADVVDYWYGEEKLYDYKKPGFSYKTAHFTQIVWKSTRELGCGWARSHTNNIYVVCYYSPKGNYIDKFPQNVQRPKPS